LVPLPLSVSRWHRACPTDRVARWLYVHCPASGHGPVNSPGNEIRASTDSLPLLSNVLEFMDFVRGSKREQGPALVLVYTSLETLRCSSPRQCHWPAPGHYDTSTDHPSLWSELRAAARTLPQNNSIAVMCVTSAQTKQLKAVLNISYFKMPLLLLFSSTGALQSHTYAYKGISEPLRLATRTADTSFSCCRERVHGVQDLGKHLAAWLTSGALRGQASVDIDWRFSGWRRAMHRFPSVAWQRFLFVSTEVSTAIADIRARLLTSATRDEAHKTKTEL
jgi:hypothetical protein